MISGKGFIKCKLYNVEVKKYIILDVKIKLFEVRP